LRKLKTKQIKDLTFDATGKIIDLFNRGDLETMKGLLAWVPPKQEFGNSQKALVVFDLLGCPNCKTEVIIAKVKVFNGIEWKDVSSLGSRRNLVSVFTRRIRDGQLRASEAIAKALGVGELTLSISLGKRMCLWSALRHPMRFGGARWKNGESSVRNRNFYAIS